MKYLKANEDNLRGAFDSLQDFFGILGLRINIKTTNIIKSGAWGDSRINTCTEKHMTDILISLGFNFTKIICITPQYKFFILELSIEKYAKYGNDCECKQILTYPNVPSLTKPNLFPKRDQIYQTFLSHRSLESDFALCY